MKSFASRCNNVSKHPKRDILDLSQECRHFNSFNVVAIDRTWFLNGKNRSHLYATVPTYGMFATCSIGSVSSAKARAQYRRGARSYATLNSANATGNAVQLILAVTLIGASLVWTAGLQPNLRRQWFTTSSSFYLYLIVETCDSIASFRRTYAPLHSWFTSEEMEQKNKSNLVKNSTMRHKIDGRKNVCCLSQY